MRCDCLSRHSHGPLRSPTDASYPFRSLQEKARKLERESALAVAAQFLEPWIDELEAEARKCGLQRDTDAVSQPTGKASMAMVCSNGRIRALVRSLYSFKKNSKELVEGDALEYAGSSHALGKGNSIALLFAYRMLQWLVHTTTKCGMMGGTMFTFLGTTMYKDARMKADGVPAAGGTFVNLRVCTSSSRFMQTRMHRFDILACPALHNCLHSCHPA